MYLVTKADETILLFLQMYMYGILIVCKILDRPLNYDLTDLTFIYEIYR